MINESINSMSTAFIAGLLTSMHCAGMCGPLACILSPRVDEKVSMQTVTVAYNVSRILSVSLVGALLGAVGAQLLEYFNASSLRFFPWAAVIFFFIIAFGADKWLPKPRWLSKLFFKLSGKVNHLPRLYSGILIGMLTPFLPCGPLYAVFALAMTSGSAVKGAEFLFAFGVGTLPLLFLVQSSYVYWSQKLNPKTINRLQRAMALIVAILLLLRLQGSFADIGEKESSCPMCHPQETQTINSVTTPQ